ncbi:hypothetical protein [Nonomuraea sp. NPDC049758]|uniref:hypothetical protein n=1 Tax=Nonomuraea sp. NPDC049758 TaxID=3154360 RepID=UPI00342D105C
MPIVLFLCVRDAGRSQTALGFFTHLAGERGLGRPGDTEPGELINPTVVEVSPARVSEGERPRAGCR